MQNELVVGSGDTPRMISPRRMSDVLLYSTLGFFGLLLIWAAFTKIDRTVHAQGRVVPTAQLQLVSNLEGGVVSEILVHAGQMVKEGTPLIRLDQTAASSDYSASQSTIASLNAKIERLQAEVDGRSPNFRSLNGPAESEQISIERSLYQSRQADLASVTQAANARLVQAQRSVAEAEAYQAAKTVARDGARQQVLLIRPLVQSGVEPQMSLTVAQRQADISFDEARAAQATVARARSGVAESQAALSQARQQWRSQAATELATAQAEAAGRREAQPTLASRLRRTVIRAPLTGMVNRVMINTVGGTARPGEPLIELVPSRSGLTIEAAVRPKDIAFVRIGQRSLVKLTAYDYSIYGGMEGKVTGISPDAIVEERSGETHYMVRVRTTSGTLVSPSGQRYPVSSGMTADVNLIGDKRTILGYLLTPFTRLSEDAFRER